MIRHRVPERLWDYGYRWVSDVMNLTHTSAGSLTGTIPLEEVTGETPDISEYLDFGFYDKVWYKDNAGLSPREPGRWLGVSSQTGRLMTYYVLTSTGSVVSRSTVQRVTNLELQVDEYIKTFEEFDARIHLKLKTDTHRSYIGSKPNPEDWADLIETDDDFREEFYKIFNSKDVKEADSYTPEVLDDTYLNMELALPRDEDGPEYARVTKRLRDKNGLPIGTSHSNPILDTRLYEVEYLDGHKAALSANTIAENLFSQIDEEGNRHVLLQDIIDHRTDGSEVPLEDAFIHSTNGGKRKKETTQGWEILLQWKDGSTSWETLKDVKSSYPAQLAEYAHLHRIADQPAFHWWVPYVIKKKQRIISKIKSKYWSRTTKFGIRIPKTVEEAEALDHANQNTFWMDAVREEMKNVRAAFELYDGNIKELTDMRYREIKMHLIFDVKMGEKFRRKARLVADGNRISTPATMTYSSVVSRNSVRICLTIAAMNDLEVLSCDIQNAFITAPNREKIWTIAGREFGSEAGKPMIVIRALYGLRSAGASFRSFLAETLDDIGFVSSPADPDVWMRPAIDIHNRPYWEYILAYVDDLLCISHNPQAALALVNDKFNFKKDEIVPPTNYLGGTMSMIDNTSGKPCWAISLGNYVTSFVKTVEETLAKKLVRLPSRCYTPLSKSYKPDLDDTGELKADGIQFYQELIGSLRWAIELGRVDILLETSLMSKFVAMPREGHLEQVLHIVGYLKQHPKLRILFDDYVPRLKEKWFKSYDWIDFYRDAAEAIPPNMPEPRGRDATITCFVDANHAGDMANRRSQTGVLIFMNQAPIHWYSKQQTTVETSTFGSEFCAMKRVIVMSKHQMRSNPCSHYVLA